jgi:hypothetical protein
MKMKVFVLFILLLLITVSIFAQTARDGINVAIVDENRLSVRLTNTTSTTKTVRLVGVISSGGGRGTEYEMTIEMGSNERNKVVAFRIPTNLNPNRAPNSTPLQLKLVRIRIANVY